MEALKELKEIYKKMNTYSMRGIRNPKKIAEKKIEILTEIHNKNPDFIKYHIKNPQWFPQYKKGKETAEPLNKQFKSIRSSIKSFLKKENHNPTLTEAYLNKTKKKILRFLYFHTKFDTYTPK